MAGAEYRSGGPPQEHAAQRQPQGDGTQPDSSQVLGQGGTFGADQPLATRNAVVDGSPAAVQPALDSPTSSVRTASPVRPAAETVVSHREQPITATDPERSRAELASLFARSVPVPDSSSMLVRVTTRAQADAVLQHVPASARRGFVKEIPTTNDPGQRHVIGIFSVDPTERETWQSQAVAAHQNGKGAAQRDNGTLFEHDSGQLTLQELSFAQQYAQTQSGQRIDSIRGRVVYGRFNSTTLALLEEEHDRARHETHILQSAAQALLPDIPTVAEPTSEEKAEKTSYTQARQKLDIGIATLDDPTFEAVKNWVRLKEAEIAIQSARYPANGTSPKENELKTAGERLLQIDEEIDEKARGINERRYLNAQAIFREIFTPYQRATQENASGDALARSAEKDSRAFEIFKRDFENVSKYKDLAVELGTTNREPGSEGFDLMVDALVVYRAEINGDPETSETYERAVNRLQRFNPGITEEEIRKEVTFVGKLVERYAQSINLPPDETIADEQIAKRNWAILELIEHLEQMKLSEQKNHIADPLPAETGSSEATKVSVFVGNDSITGAPIYATLGEGKDELEFGKDKKEDFRKIYQTAQAYIRAHPEQLSHTYTFDLPSGRGIRDAFRLNLKNVPVTHDEQTATRYVVEIGLSVDYFFDEYNAATNTFSWTNEDGDAVELPAYVRRPESEERAHFYPSDYSEQTNLFEVPQGFKIRSITLIPRNEPNLEKYDITFPGIRDDKVTIKGRKGIREKGSSRISMSDVKNRKRLKDVMDALPE